MLRAVSKAQKSGIFSIKIADKTNPIFCRLYDGLTLNRYSYHQPSSSTTVRSHSNQMWLVNCLSKVSCSSLLVAARYVVVQ